MKNLGDKTLKEIIQEKYAGQLGQDIISAFQEGINNGETGNKLKKRLLQAIIPGLSDLKYKAILDVMIPAEWIMFGVPPPPTE